MTGLAEIAGQSVGASPANVVAKLRVAHLPEYQAAHAGPADALTVVHERVGRNREPLSKLAQFGELLQSWVGPQPELAMLKFCYVDVERADDAERLWTEYQFTLAKLQQRHPQIAFVHCTVPLRALPFGLSAQLRRMLGHRHPQVAANRAREWLNERLREQYGPRGLLFDLARVEATRSDGQPCTIHESGDPVRSLAPEWTYDGGHLNARGRTMAAAALLHFFQTFGNR